MSNTLYLTKVAFQNWSKAHEYFFPATTFQIPALWPTGAGELNGSDPQAGFQVIQKYELYYK